MIITLLIALLINPFIIYEVGFQFSYIISTTLNIMSKKINNKKNFLIKSLYTSYICFIVSLPICIYHFNQINIISIFLNIILIPLISIIIFPLSLITFTFPFIYNIYELSINILELINNIFSSIPIFTLT